MFNCTKGKSAGKNKVRTNEHIIVQMNKKVQSKLNFRTGHFAHL